MSTLSRAKIFLRRHLRPAHWDRLRGWYIWMRSAKNAGNLKTLANMYGSDKWNAHFYAEHYQKHFAPFRRKKVNVLEIGIGGYDNPRAGGASLFMWKWFFRRGRIFGIDFYDKSALQESRIMTFQGSQSDPEFLKRVASIIGTLHIVIDDGSHKNQDVLTSFQNLFPLLAEGGIYAVEDTQTSYWPGDGGSLDLEAPGTTMGFFKKLADGLNYEEFLDPAFVPSYTDKHVVSVHFYHNLVIVYKGRNNEGSVRRFWEK